ncbi:MAG: sensor histidine kinase [Isosphaeraceae bacterium]|nr:sensor histidine kinase [Isosphaeraceae bacterium]
MKIARGIIDGFDHLRRMLGWQGVMIALITLASFLFGTSMLISEATRPRRTRGQVVQSLLAGWIRSPDYLGLNLRDYTLEFARSPGEEEHARLRSALERLGEDLERRESEFPLIAVERLELVDPSGRTVARRPERREFAQRDRLERVSLPLVAESGTPGFALLVDCRVVPEIDAVFRAGEEYDVRVLRALFGLSGFSLLCFGHMVLYVRDLRERVARESAREAVLDLADTTCHELGNVAFVFSNERRNLTGHIDLIDRFIGLERGVRRTAARRVGLDEPTIERLETAIDREYERNGIAPDFEIARSVRSAGEVCRQLALCSDYITMTVRELDAHLARTPDAGTARTSSRIAPIELFQEAATLMAPRVARASATLEIAPDAERAPPILVVRHLMVHALVNLIKNALEASNADGSPIRITLSAEANPKIGEVVLIVADDGPGIAPEILPRLFQEGVSTKGPRRGRGLAIVKESVRAQGGSILAENAPDHGCAFRITMYESVENSNQES